MFGDVNSVTLMGNITRDLELRHTPNGTSVCSFSIATNRRYQQNDEWKEEVQFHNIVIWGKRAESFVQRAKKGTRVYIEGRLQTRSWDDQEGKKQYKTEVVVLRLILIDRYEKFDSGMQKKDEDISPKASDKDPGTKDQIPEKKEDTSEEKIDPDDLPF